MSTSAVLTLWFVTAVNPSRVLEDAPKADRGFGRKYLSQLNPAWPVTAIGQFPLNRSTQASKGEYYVGGFPGVTVVQTWVEDIGPLADLDENLLTSRPAPDVYVIAQGDDSDFGGFAHFSGGVLKRALSGTREHLVEDIGLPAPFELPYWSGEKAEPQGGISLPFEPKDIAKAAEEAWLGIAVSPDGPDIQIVGYAVDGRPEPKLDEKKPDVPNKSGVEIVAYDDYEIHTPGEGEEFSHLAKAAGAALRRLQRELMRRLSELRTRIDERLRHTDRS